MDKREAAAQKFKERTASKRFKLPEGQTTFRVMPNAKGVEKAEYIEYRMHSNVGARNAYLRCGKNIRGEGECWLCDTIIPKLEKSGKKSHRKAAEALKAKDNFAVQIIYKSEGKWMGPVLWEMSSGIANKLLGVMSRRDVSHPEKGYNLTISRTGTTMTTTKYGDIDRDDEKSEVPEKLLAKLKPFSEVLKKYDEEVMKSEYYGHEQDDDEPEEEEEDTKKKGSEDEEEEEEDEKPKSKKKKEEEDDESESESEESEEEEDEKPKKKGKKVEEEEEESEEEEEEEKPKKKGKKADEEEEESEEEEEIPDLEEEEEEEKPKGKKGKKDEEEEEESESEEDEEEEKPKSKKKSRDEDEEDEEEEKPKSKKKSRDADEDDE